MDTGDIEFRPITLLLGQNSSGKSTFLRSLPLLKQSIRTRSKAPILWYGDFVDFGSIKEVKSTLSSDDSVYFEFISNSISVGRGPYYYDDDPPSAIANARLELELFEHDETTLLRRFIITAEDDKLRATVDSKGAITDITVNGQDYTRLLPPDRYRLITSELVPQLVMTNRSQNRHNLFYAMPVRTVPIGSREIIDFLSARLHNNISLGTIRNLSRRIMYAPGRDFENRLRSVRSSLKSWARFVDEICSPQHSIGFNALRSLYFLAYLSDILAAFSNSLTTDFQNLAYVGPSRATGERYYRHQELAVDQIDPQGRNLAMFIHSLPSAQKEQFSRWLEEAIGYSIKIIRSSGHMQIELKEVGSETFHNLADMGYGFSQVLPVMAQIWSRQVRDSLRHTSPFVTIEQPELHLHPAYQARLADILANAAVAGRNNSRRGINFVIETHSEALINRLGELIYEKKLPREAVSIYIFQKAPLSESTSISRSEFDDNGLLTNWPLGFFSAAI